MTDASHGASTSAMAQEDVPGFRRSVREQLAWTRAKRLKDLAETLLHSLLCKHAGPAGDLNAAELSIEAAGWLASLKQHFSDLTTPYLLDDERSRLFLGKLCQQDASSGTLALHYSNLAALAYSLLASRASALADSPWDEALAKKLLQCAESLALPPFSAVKDKYMLVALVVGLRLQSVLLSEGDLEQNLKRALGPTTPFPAGCQNIGKAAIKELRSEVAGCSREALRRLNPFDHLLEQAITFGRAAFASLAERDAAARPLAPVARPSYITFSLDDVAVDRAAQLAAMRASKEAVGVKIDDSPWQTHRYVPLVSAEVHGALSSLSDEALDAFLAGLTETPSSPAQGQPQPGPSRLRFGPGGIEVAPLRSAASPDLDLFDTQDDADQIAFDSFAAAEKELLRGAAKGKRKAVEPQSEQEAPIEVAPKRRRGKKQQDRSFWTADEEELLKAELEMLGHTSRIWSDITARHGPEGTESNKLARRNDAALKEKARNYERRREEVPAWLSAV